MNELVILDMRLFARRHFPARPPGRRKRLGDAQKLLSRPASAAARHARPRAGHPGGALGDYPRTSALDARVNPRIKSGDVHDETESAALMSGRRLDQPVAGAADQGRPPAIST